MTCKVWNNGCNDCQVDFGKITSCGTKTCLTKTTPTCKEALTVAALLKKDTTKFEDESKIDDMSDCKTWFDGCNNCNVEDGHIMECTRRFCRNLGTPFCRTKKTFDSPLDGCKKWSDGCNIFDVKNGAMETTKTVDVASCTDENKKKAYCKEYIASKATTFKGKTDQTQEYLKGCETWFDGCNKCGVTTDGILTGCTKMYCEKNERAYCAKKTGVAIVKDAK